MQWYITGFLWWQEVREIRTGEVREVNHHVSLFYADDVLVVYTGPDWLQGAFDLTGLYTMVGIQKHSGKTVCILC